jgi:hypothetical protein
MISLFFLYVHAWGGGGCLCEPSFGEGVVVLDVFNIFAGVDRVDAVPFCL